MHRKESFALEDGFLGEQRVLTKFQANLVIPKHSYSYFSTKRSGYINNGLLYILLVRGRGNRWEFT